MKQISFLIILFLLTYISCKSKEEWKSRSIYQILTDRFGRTSDTGVCNLGAYCGGNYQGIIQHLDYIKGMGFDAIWISPIVENTEGSYHGYHLTNLYKLNTHYGTEDDFKALISACHDKDIWVMVDVVANHVGPVGNDFSRITPFNSADHYHDNCDITDWGNQWQVENCRLSGLPEKKTTNDAELKMVYTHGKKRNAIANAVIQEGNGTITINRIPIQNIEPKTLRVKIFEPILILGVDKFKNLKIRVRVCGGGSVAQLYAARTAIAKGIVAWDQKYVDEETKDEARKNLLNYDKNLLVADYRRLEPKKYGGPGARSRKQKSYR